MILSISCSGEDLGGVSSPNLDWASCPEGESWVKLVYIVLPTPAAGAIPAPIIMIF